MANRRLDALTQQVDFRNIVDSHFADLGPELGREVEKAEELLLLIAHVSDVKHAMMWHGKLHRTSFCFSAAPSSIVFAFAVSAIAALDSEGVAVLDGMLQAGGGCCLLKEGARRKLAQRARRAGRRPVRRHVKAENGRCEA